MKALRGVNLGGWLVLEKWMTPSLFSASDAEDEKTLSFEHAQRIKKHHESFILEKDFAWMAKNGLEAVRIPLGYWVFGDEPPFVGSVTQLDFAFKMAEKYELKVVISLHGAPGSQNGKKHSGQLGKAGWHWNSHAKRKTLQTIERLAKRYGKNKSLWGIEVLNEPIGGFLKNFVLRKYYKNTYAIIRQHCTDKTKIIISDSFHPERWVTFMSPPTYKNVVLDVHLYQGFSPFDRRAGLTYHLKKALDQKKRILNWQRHIPVMVGEWSLGSGMKTFAIPDKEKKRKMLRQYASNQITSYDAAAAWFFWSYKTEAKNNWNFCHLVESEVIVLPDSGIIYLDGKGANI